LRERLTLAFTGLALAILVVVVLVRSVAVENIVRSHEEDHLGVHADQVARTLDARYEAGEPVDAAVLQRLTGDEMRLRVTRPGEPTVEAQGVGYAVGDLGETISARQSAGRTTVEAVESDAIVRQTTAEQLGSLMALMLALVVMAGVVGLLLANRLTRPVRELAESAAMLGRGRFDIQQAESRIPEIAAVGAALQSSAHQIERSMQRDREYLQHTSHVLRTPLTGLRLEVEEVLLQDDLDEDVRRSLVRCLKDVSRLQDTVSELVEFERNRGLVAGAEVRVVDLGLHVANHWRERLPATRQLRTFVDSGECLGVTPGPVEQLLDQVLADVLRHGDGEVTVNLDAAESHLKVRVRSAPAQAGTTPAADRPEAHTAQTFTELLGGRWSGDPLDGGVEILLPRR
jgi:signal transduction histidine kinase